jgi:hypothetical protein
MGVREMLDVILEEIGQGTDAELALADWLEEKGEPEAGANARSTRRLNAEVVAAIVRTGGWEAIMRTVPWVNTKSSIAWLRRKLGKLWSVRGDAKERIHVRAAPARLLPGGRMTTSDWDQLSRMFRKVRSQVVLDEWRAVIIPPETRREVMEGMNARRVASSVG